jgi:hypothetical protein
MWFARWHALHATGEHNIAIVSHKDLAHRTWLLTTLEDIHTSALRARARIGKRLLTGHAARVTSFGGAWALPRAYLKLSLRADPSGCRM